jgi:predicted secreted protein
MLTFKKHTLSWAVVGFIVIALFAVNGCKKGGAPSDSIVLNMSKSTWNVSYPTSAGTIEITLQGVNVQNVQLDTIQMTADDSSAAPVTPVSVTFRDGNVYAQFLKNQVFALLVSPSPGSTHTVTVSFYISGGDEPVDITVTITVSDEVEDELDLTELSLEIDPGEWSLNFPNSSGTVQAFIRGVGIDKIDLTSFEMAGKDSPEAPLAAISAVINGDHIHARFAKNQVTGLLVDPIEGMTYTITVSFVETGGSGERLVLEADIVIEIDEDDDDDDIDPGELSLEIDPEEWSLNYPKSSGTVTAFIEGEGFDKIDLNSIEMLGDDPAAAPLPADSVSLKGDKVHARFAKNQVLDLLLNPDEGSTHEIIISFLEIDGSGERIELSAMITIEDDDDGDDDDDGTDPSDMELDIVPPQWNMNYSKDKGHVTAFIRGNGIENINLEGPIILTGDNGAEPLAASSASLQGNHVKIKFPKNQVLDLLDNPSPGSSHVVTVTFTLNGGGNGELSTTISIVGAE